jgi:thioredoxin-like negative regulator of GroEL
MIVEITHENFEELVLQSKKNVILDFYGIITKSWGQIDF